MGHRLKYCLPNLTLSCLEFNLIIVVWIHDTFSMHGLTQVCFKSKYMALWHIHQYDILYAKEKISEKYLKRTCLSVEIQNLFIIIFSASIGLYHSNQFSMRSVPLCVESDASTEDRTSCHALLTYTQRWRAGAMI